MLHLALFRPAPGLGADQRRALLDTLRHAVAGIPQIQRARVGRRRRLGRAYDEAAGPYEYLVMLEFASEDDLRAYLDHPAHTSLGEAFYTATDAALACDFELVGLEDLDAGD
jgi:hypothetical protein